MVTGATALAEAWEDHPDLRRRAQRLQLASCTHASSVCAATLWHFWVCNVLQVEGVGMKVTRETLRPNQKLVTTAIRHLGNRVSVDVCAMHLQSCYEMQNISIPGLLKHRYMSAS